MLALRPPLRKHRGLQRSELENPGERRIHLAPGELPWAPAVARSVAPREKPGAGRSAGSSVPLCRPLRRPGSMAVRQHECLLTVCCEEQKERNGVGLRRLHETVLVLWKALYKRLRRCCSAATHPPEPFHRTLHHSFHQVSGLRLVVL